MRARALWPSQIRHQIIAGAALIQLLLMSVVVLVLVENQRTFLSHQSLEQTQELAQTLAINSSSWILANDVVGLAEIVASVARFPDLRYAMVTDRDGKVLAHTDPSRVGLFASDAASRSLLSGESSVRVLHAGHDSVDVAAPVMSATGERVGWARLGQGRKRIAAILSTALWNGVLYTLLAVFIGSVSALLIGLRLAAGFERLLAFSGKIRDGRRDLRMQAGGDDEISRLGAGINEMLDALLQREREIVRLKDYAESLIQTANVIFVQLDEHGCVRRLNEEAEKVIGYRQSELAGKNWFKMVLPLEEFPRVWDQFQRLLSAGEAAKTFENVIRTRSGEERRIMWQNSLLREGERRVGTISFGVDITERHLAEEAVRRSESDNRATLNSLLVGVVIHAADTSVIYSNEEARRILGLTEDQLSGKTASDQAWMFLSEDGVRLELADFPVSTVASTKRPLTGLILGVRRPDRDFVTWVSVGALPVFAAEGGLERIIVNFMDITALKRAEDEIRTLNAGLEERVRARTAQLEAANKDLEAFTYSVSHDLRAPLRAMDGFSHILMEDFAPKLEPECARYLGLVRKGAQTMGRLIDDLLAFSRLGRQAIAKSHVSMEEVVQAALESLKDQVQGRRVTFKVGALAPCEGDFALLQQVWVNLIANALKFTRARPEAVIEIDSRDEAGETVYRVKDNGAGFDMRYADKLFKVFQRLHPKEDYEGTGVGLAIVARVVERHGGKVWARGEVDRGAEFFFTLGGRKP